MTEAGANAVTSLLQIEVIGPVFVLGGLALTWMLKKLLSSNDKTEQIQAETIKILRANIEKKDDKLDKAMSYIATLSSSMEKLADTVERGQYRNEDTREKILSAMANCKSIFNSLPKSSKG